MKRLSAWLTAWMTLNRRWLVATGGVVLAVLVMDIRCPARNRNDARRIERSADSIVSVVRPVIRRERVIADSAARAESAAVANAARLRSRREVAIESHLPTARDVAAVAPLDSNTVLVDAILAEQDRALAAANVRATAFETALDVSELRVSETDSLLRVAVKVEGMAAGPCRWLFLVPCLSRRAVIIDVAGALLLRRLM